MRDTKGKVAGETSFLLIGSTEGTLSTKKKIAQHQNTRLQLMVVSVTFH